MRHGNEYSSVRQGLWLVIELVDDLTERLEDAEVIQQLMAVRNGAYDLLFLVRRLDVEKRPEGKL